MRSLNIKRELNGYTRKQGVLIGGTVFSLHILNDEVIITDNRDYTKIYSIQTITMYNLCEDEM